MRCNRCETDYTIEDNYCRQCGSSLRVQRLPVRRESSVPERWQGGSPVVKGATAVAAGAVGQFVLRALVRHLVTSRGKSNGRSLLPLRKPKQAQLPNSEYSVTETVMQRKVTIRR